jgi:hypothetical protein
MRNIYPKPDKNTVMKSSSVFLIIGVIIVAVGVAWIISGGPALTAQTNIPQTTVPATAPATPLPTAAIPVTSAAIPVTTAPPAVTTPSDQTAAATPVTTMAAPASGADIREHFVDVTYSGTNRLERLNYSASRSRVIICTISANDDDMAQIEKTVKEFNEASPTLRISENIKESGTGDIFIKFLPGNGLSAISLTDAPDTGSFSEPLTRRELFQGGVPAAKIIRGTVYINADLRGDARKHVLIRSLMYQMGLTGDSAIFSDSVFYAGDNSNTNLSSADKKIISMLYTDGVYSGMTMEELQKKIYLPS